MEIVSNRGKFSRSLEKKDLTTQEKDNKLLSQKQILKSTHSLHPSRQAEGLIPIYPATRSKSNDVVLQSKVSYQTEQIQPQEQLMYSNHISEVAKTMPIVTECLQSSAQFPTKNPKSKVFNKFTIEQKQQMRETLQLLQNPVFKGKLEDSIVRLIRKVRVYIEELESNNQKLLQVKHFLQKEYSNLIAEKQIWKRERCNKNYCLQCRYHLEKENDWQQEKSELESSISRLKEEVSSMRTLGSPSIERTNVSIMVEQTKLQKPGLVSTLREEVLTLEEQLQRKDEEYLILLTEFKYLTTLNKETKGRLSTLMEEYKYLSIENRTLLRAKEKLMQKEVECAKLKGERDQFKKRAIQCHRKLMEMEDGSESGQEEHKVESMFSLSSASELT